MPPIITIENLSKKYHLGRTHTYLLSEKIGDGLRSLYRKIRKNNRSDDREKLTSNNEIWALKDINLEIHE